MTSQPSLLKCPECGSVEIMKRGFHITRKGRIQRFQCKRCGRTFQLTNVRQGGRQ